MLLYTEQDINNSYNYYVVMIIIYYIHKHKTSQYAVIYRIGELKIMKKNKTVNNINLLMY